MAASGGGGDDHEQGLLREALLAAAPRTGTGKGEADMEEIRSVRAFLRHAAAENRRLWYLAGPAIVTSIAQYSLGAITLVFAGHLTTLELDAVSTENNVIAGLAFGITLGMGSALETLCCQAYGAKQAHMLGVYLQRSWIILNAMALLMLPLYLFATPILRFFHQDADIAALAGRLALYMIPQLFAYAFNFPIQKFLQAQSKVMAMAAVSAAALVLHVALSWLLVGSMRMGLVGLAVALNASWWFVVLGQLAYILMGYCPGAWNIGWPSPTSADSQDSPSDQPSCSAWSSGSTCSSSSSSATWRTLRSPLPLSPSAPTCSGGRSWCSSDSTRPSASACRTSWAPAAPARPSSRSWWCSCRRWPSAWPSSSPSSRSATCTARPSRRAPRCGRRGEPRRGVRLLAAAQQRAARAVGRRRRRRLAVARRLHQPRMLLPRRHPRRVPHRLPAPRRGAGDVGRHAHRRRAPDGHPRRHHAAHRLGQGGQRGVLQDTQVGRLRGGGGGRQGRG